MNSPSNYDDLVQAELDGCASEAERAAVAERMAVDPAARDDKRRLEALVATLGAVQPVSPPAGMVAEIMRRVRSDREASSRSLWDRVRVAWSSSRHVLPYAYAAAAGAALCFVAIQSFGSGAPFGRAVSSVDAVGTMEAPLPFGARTVPLEAGDVHGTVRVRGEKGGDALDVEFQNPSPVDVFVRFDPSEASLAGISDPAGGLDRVVAADGEVGWSQAPGGRVTVLFARRGGAAATIRLGIDSHGDRQDAGVVKLPADR
jgi:hypothetical protein